MFGRLEVRISLLSLSLMLAASTMNEANASGEVINTGEPGDRPSVSGGIIAFDTREDRLGLDVNGDGDLNDRMIRYHDIATGITTNTGLIGDWPIVSGRTIVFGTREYDLGGDWVIRYYDLDAGSVNSTSLTARHWDFSGSLVAFYGVGQTIGYHDILTGLTTYTGVPGWGPTISGNIIALSTIERLHWGGDMNGDGDDNDVVITYYDIASEEWVNTGAVGDYQDSSGSLIAFETGEVRVGEDLNGDGDLDDWFIRYHDISVGPGSTIADGYGPPSVSGNIVAFPTVEYWLPEDLNGDGDIDDQVIRYMDVSTGSVTTVEVGELPAVGGNILAFRNWDGEIAYIDLGEDPSIDSLAVQIEDFVNDGSIDSEGVAEAMYAHLVQAQAMIERGSDIAAVNKLNAFIHLVEALSGRHITTPAAESLIESAHAVIAGL